MKNPPPFLASESSSPILGSATTGDPLSPPASHPPTKIPSPPPFSSRVEPSYTFFELSPCLEFHTTTVDCLFWLTAEIVVAGFCSDHRGLMPPFSPCRDSRRPAPLPSPAVWLREHQLTACCGCCSWTVTAFPRRCVYHRGFDSNPTTLLNPKR